MAVALTRILLIAAMGLIGLPGCKTVAELSEPPTLGAEGGESAGEITGAVAAPATPPAAPELLGTDPNDDLSLAKKYYRQGGFGLAEKHFRKAVETNPRDAEAWVGLAASYDRLRRFDLADRAYAQAIRMIGPTPEILNNKGFSYMLRGDYRRARATLLAAKAKSPNNPHINANLELLAEAQRNAKGVN